MMIFIIILTLIILALIILSLIILIILIFSFQNAGFPMNPFDISQGLEILGPWPMEGSSRCLLIAPFSYEISESILGGYSQESLRKS